MPRHHAVPLSASILAACLALHGLAACGSVFAGEFAFRTQQIAADLTIGYATTLLDMNGDRRTDIVVVDADRVVWYENPDWQVHTIIEAQTKRDNVCIAAHDIDGDGRIDFALGADWKPFNTAAGARSSGCGKGSRPTRPGRCCRSPRSRRRTACAGSTPPAMASLNSWWCR